MLLPYVAIAVGFAGLILSFWSWHSKRMRRQDERQKAISLGIQWLITRASDKPDEYVLSRLRDATKEDD